MTALLKRAARGVLGSAPVRGVLQARAFADDPVTVLCYHTLGPDDGGVDAWTALRVADFRAQVAMLSESHDIVTLDAALAEGPGRAGRRRPRAVLTFDDGEAGLYRHLLPVLDDLRVPVLIYVATAQIESGQPYWFDRVMGALGTGAHRVEVPGLGLWIIPAVPGAARWSVLGALLEALKTVDPVQREALVEGVLAAHPTPPGRPPLAPLTRAELAAVAASPFVTIGAHSHCHNLLDQISVTAARESMARSRDLLRDWTGQAVAHFAWPNGNHTAALRAVAAELGFVTAAALDGGLWRRGADLFALPRVGVGRHDDAARLRLRMIGF